MKNSVKAMVQLQSEPHLKKVGYVTFSQWLETSLILTTRTVHTSVYPTGKAHLVMTAVTPVTEKTAITVLTAIMNIARSVAVIVVSAMRLFVSAVVVNVPIVKKWYAQIASPDAKSVKNFVAKNV